MKHLIQTQVVVVGAGPVGLTAALLLQKFKIGHVVLQKNKSLRSYHPSAHWLNIRTKQIFAQIPALNPQLQLQQQPWKHFTHYRYMQHILGREFGHQNNFYPSIQAKLEQCKRYSHLTPSHVSQDKLATIMVECLKQDNIQLETKVTEIVENQSDKVVLTAEKGEKREKVRIEASCVIGCDGYHSTLRKGLGIQMEGEQKVLDFINIHFKSQQLAQKITEAGQDAMLHFVYNTDFPACLVNHSKKDGIFVLQIPNYPPFLDLLSLHTPQQLILSTLPPNTELPDLQVLHTGRWSLSSQIASRFCQGDIFLAGDAAHSIPPAGGFGMNVGIQDVHNLVHKFNILKQNTEMGARREVELLRYGTERKEADQKYLKLAKEGFETSLEIARELGFKPEYVDLAKKFFWLPFKKQLFSMATKKMFKPHPISKTIKMFENQEFQIERLSKYRFQMIQDNLNNNNICYYMDKSVKREDFPELLGVQDDAIKIMEMVDEKLVRSDGIVLH